MSIGLGQRIAAATLAFVGVTACGGRSIAEGRYVQICSERDEPLCAGTVQAIDAYFESVAGVIGEELPNERFVRIELSDDVGTGESTTVDRLVRRDRIVTNDPFHRHELVHAVLLNVWPRSHRALEEGLASMLGTRGVELEPWPKNEPLDPLLEWNEDYNAAAYIVSQIVDEEGFDGLRRLWHRLNEDSGAAEFRGAFAQEFGRPVDDLIAEVDVGGVPTRRFPLLYDVCPGEVDALLTGAWEATGPESCADDPRSIGARPRRFGGGFSVWTHHWVEVGAEGTLTVEGDEGVVFRRCGLGNDWRLHDVELPPGTHDFLLGAGKYLVEVEHRLEQLGDEPTARVAFLPAP